MTKTSTKDCGFCRSIDSMEYVRPIGDTSTLFRPRGGGIGPQHYMIVPRLHVERFDSDPDITAITMRDAALVAPTLFRDYNISVNSGAAAGQTAFHLHVHIIGRWYHDQVTMPWPDTRSQPEWIFG